MITIVVIRCVYGLNDPRSPDFWERPYTELLPAAEEMKISAELHPARLRSSCLDLHCNTLRLEYMFTVAVKAHRDAVGELLRALGYAKVIK